MQAPCRFELVWSEDDWASVHRDPGTETALGISYVDIPVHDTQQAPIRFTFYWTDEGRWEGRDIVVEVT